MYPTGLIMSGFSSTQLGSICVFCRRHFSLWRRCSSKNAGDRHPKSSPQLGHRINVDIALYILTTSSGVCD
jgi:hypothetical protein